MAACRWEDDVLAPNSGRLGCCRWVSLGGACEVMPVPDEEIEATQVPHSVGEIEESQTA